MLPGVYTAKKKNGTIYYRSNITYHNKHISLGSYPSELLAHQSYLEAAALLASYQEGLDRLFHSNSLLSFDKQVALANFRDHQIYFKNPIYLRNNFFIYFISPQDELKFDIDDLFYYSSHKIMRRKGHLFVSDYGMQINILSRYGIKNYGVAGKDYLFVNGDSTDFRYSNIKIINKYYGVTQLIQENAIYYKTKINIKGIHTIGIYRSEEEAAIAYNKAVDLAQKYGVKKNYMTNFITAFSARKYADIYTKTNVSPKFISYLENNFS